MGLVELGQPLQHRNSNISCARWLLKRLFLVELYVYHQGVDHIARKPSKMINRFVRQIAPQPKKSDPNYTFDDFAAYNNIVLLGDPGAGKTYLFEQCAKAVGNQFIRTRNFLNIPLVDREVTLFIDALDEKRSGSDNEDVVDKIVQKLFSCPPKKLRISCRSQDWLGESDLSAFLPYFEQNGGYVVLHLQQLSKDEQIAILQDHGIAAPENFIQEAENHSVTEFLYNPQNLIMLAKTVKTGDWPKTRSELFQFATDSLLTEENSEHANCSHSRYSNTELEPVAGVICALRLLSDVGGISLKNNDNRPDYPSYRTIPFYDREMIRATLSRRIFFVGDEIDTVDYRHRTIAEYLAAKWLVDCVRKGLPLGRLRSLIGFDGYPSSELRGLHAWLAVFLSESAGAFINADPYGILTYGDAASLSPSNKKNLLIALSELSEKDPWFRTAGLYSSLNGFTDNSIVPIVHKMLITADTSYSLRMIILESLSVGTPIPELKDDLLNIVISKTASYSEKEEAITALIHQGDDGKQAVAGIYHDLNDKNDNCIRLRRHIICHLYNNFFAPKDVCGLLIESLGISDRILPVGSLWSIVDFIPKSDIPNIFDELYQYTKRNSNRIFSDSLNYNEVYFVIDDLLSRIFDEHSQLSAKQIWQYFCVRNHYSHSNYSYGEKTKKLQQQLSSKKELFHEIVDEAILSLDDRDLNFLFLYNLKDSFLGVITLEIILERLINHIKNHKENSAKIQFMYRLSFVVLFTLQNPARKTFEFLLSFGKHEPEFLKIKESVIFCEVEDWRQKQNERNFNAKKEKIERIKKDKADFKNHRFDIVSASHFGWLSYISSLYYSRRYDVDKTLSPRERIASFLGSENVVDAIKGLTNILDSSELPSLDFIINSELDGREFSWWYAILAGSDEAWEIDPDINIFSDDLLQILLVLDLRLVIPIKDRNEDQEYQHKWKKKVMEKRLDIFIKTYLHIINTLLEHKQQNIKALNNFLNNNLIPLSSRIPTILKIVTKYPNNPGVIEDLLGFLLEHSDAHTELSKIAGQLVSSPNLIKDEKCYQTWLVSYYLLSPENCQEAYEIAAKANHDIIFLTNRLLNTTRDDTDKKLEISLIQLETLITTAATHFPDTPYPESSYGTRNIWDGSQIIKDLINRVSSFSSLQASESLSRLLQLPQLTTYNKSILHALSNQQSRRRESLFQQVDWKKTIQTLSNQTPANVADLHSLVIDHLKDLSCKISNENSDIYKNFWNEGHYGKVSIPKSEETGRDILLNLLRIKLQPLGIICEPEGHMVADKRADIVIQHSDLKIPIELKRDYHKDVWTAALNQLDRLYTRDPYSAGYGIYAVFWYGEKREPHTIPRTPHTIHQPTSAKSMEEILNATIPTDKKNHIYVIVIDVSGEIP
ncbi:NACHT domain-containing protein [Serratia fonticola]|uniref:NACHT domain-containing protein n=1 Tax=Serratia fonticola TaxID=47917 RepID=UPI001F3D09ED|nr:hypothetical protein [Serratia fonticola]